MKDNKDFFGEIFKSKAINILSIFSTDSSNDDANELEKGGKRAVVGEERMFGDKKYQKTSSGWKPVGKGNQQSEQKDDKKSTTSKKDDSSNTNKQGDDEEAPKLSTQDFAKDTSTTDLKEFVEDHNSSKKLASAAKKELQSRGESSKRDFKYSEDSQGHREAVGRMRKMYDAMKGALDNPEELQVLGVTKEEAQKRVDNIVLWMDGAKDHKKTFEEKRSSDLEDINKSQNDDDILEKGGKRAVIGEKRIFGGREFIKTANGWKFHGKGTGPKTKQHRQDAASHIREQRKNEREQLSKEDQQPTSKKEEKKETSKHKVGDSVIDDKGRVGKVTHVSDKEIAVEHENGDMSGYTHDQVKKHSTDNTKKTPTDKHKEAMDAGATEVEADQIARGKRNKDDHSGKSKGATTENKTEKTIRLETIAKFQPKKKLYEAVNKKYGTDFKSGDIEEFEDNEMRKQLQDDDIKSIIDAEKEDKKDEKITKTITVSSASDIPSSFYAIQGKKLKVKNTKQVDFASGKQTYYVVEHNGKEYEVPERFLSVKSEYKEESINKSL